MVSGVVEQNLSHAKLSLGHIKGAFISHDSIFSLTRRSSPATKNANNYHMQKILTKILR